MVDLIEQVTADRIMDNVKKDGLNRSKKIEQRPGWQKLDSERLSLPLFLKINALQSFHLR